MAHYLAIDPGVSGCAVILQPPSINPDVVVDYFFPNKVKHGKGSRIDLPSFAGFLRKWDHVNHCFIEAVSAAPVRGARQGVTSMFNFGHSAGSVEGMVAFAGLPLDRITPAVWKRKYGFIGADKDAPRAKLSMLLPTLTELHAKGKGQAMADAVYIGMCGMAKVGAIPDGYGT